MEIITPEPLPVDPLVQALSPEKLEDDVQRFLGMLDARGSEEELHQFLASHSYFFNNFLRLYGASPLYSKVRLGSEFEADFAWFDSGSFGPEWRLAEIEAPSQSMFKKSGEPSAALNHAIQQVRDWQEWIRVNIAYARQVMPHIEYPLGFVFVGRRDEITTATYKRLRRLSYESAVHFRIHTLDRFADNALSVLHLLKDHGGTWPVPMRAYSHADLADRKPSWAWEYLSGDGIASTLSRYRDARIESRAAAVRDFDESRIVDEDVDVE
ncbi:Shedu anti-phage system protein SduA domain-containing protein [Polyangium aurulentum]|uniref:Shedu anti-phage system protein SduA domain-containing protein n=1 Tax=Polyangium aurulentum TaxID=2567896 RepID=UPI0010AE4607|nr:Shedu anti-phage system protein SduA domain-containing protein [Polyangium aurulentum]UQA62565.1 DUF4263 domain-containing protein [Polyangium aurulentum]